jgi:uncharacterized protein YecT (DUF1311 family)
LICSDGGLAKLDRALADVFAARRKELPAEQAQLLLQQQRDWLKTRGTACPVTAAPNDDELKLPVRWKATACVASLYRNRLAALGAPVQDAQAAEAAAQGYAHPLCIAAAQPSLGDNAAPSAVPLKACNAGNQANQPEHSGQSLVVHNPQTAMYPVVSYQTLGTLPDGREVGFLYRNAGNTLESTEIIALRRAAQPNGDTLLTTETLIQGGDRCIGGLYAAQRTGDAVVVTEHATPVGLLKAAGAKTSSGGQKETLSDCAACCAGTVSRSWLVRDLASVKRASVITAAQLESEGGDIDDKDARSKCYAKVIDAAAPKLPHTVDADSLAALGKKFDACVSAGGN